MITTHRAQKVLLVALALMFMSSVDAFANNSAGNQSVGHTDTYAATAGLDAKTSFGPPANQCVMQILTMTQVGAKNQAEVGLARCNSWDIDGCTGGHKYIELEYGGAFTCYQKGTFVDNQVYNGDISAPGPDYTNFTGIIDGEGVNAHTGFIYGSYRFTAAAGETNGNAPESCPNNNNLTMHFSDWTVYRVANGGQYVTGNQYYQGTPLCFQAPLPNSTGDFNVTLY